VPRFRVVKPKNPYEVLGVPRGASDDQIRDAQQRAAKEYHSDRDGVDAVKEQRLKEINAAAALLRDPVQKARLDAQLAEEDRLRAAAAAAPPPNVSACSVVWLMVL
jgi:curved DNA-binding protein CbpA